MDREAEVEALAHGLLEARGGGELVVLLRGSDAFARAWVVLKDAGRCTSKAVVVSAAASSAEATRGVLTFSMPRTVIWPLYLPAILWT